MSSHMMCPASLADEMDYSTVLLHKLTKLNSCRPGQYQILQGCLWPLQVCQHPGL